MEDKEVLKKKNQNRESQADIWAKILKGYQTHCPSPAKVIELMLIIPSSTVAVKRLFKVLKEMKSKKGNRLSAKKLKTLFDLPFLGFGKLRQRARVRAILETIAA